MKTFLTLLLLGAGCALFALRSGDDAAELKLEYVSGGPVALITPEKTPEQSTGAKLLVLFRAGADSAPELLPMLQELGKRHLQLKILAVTADGRELAAKYAAGMKDLNFAVASDSDDGKGVRKYMAGSMLYPAAFLIDRHNRIVWNGETTDLPERLNEFFSGKLDERKYRKLAPLLDDLQSRMRSGEDRMADYALRRVLMVDPANITALRMRMFMLESTNRVTAAWNLVADQLKAHPQERKLYLLQLDLAMRYAQFTPQMSGIAKLYLEKVAPDAAADCALAWILLTRSQFNASSLQTAGVLLRRSEKTMTGSPDELAKAEYYGCDALYCAMTGRLEQALAQQRRVSAILKKTAPFRLNSSLEMEKYYMQAIELGRAMPSAKQK